MEKLKIRFHPLFWFFLVILVFSNNFLSIFSYLVCVVLHEFGHFLMANYLGYKLNKITFLPFGVSISGKENVFYKPSHEILVAISGPIVNLILMVICLALFWTFPVLYSYLENFYFANFITLTFNFLPVYPLDGGRVLYATIKRKQPLKRAYRLIKIIGFIISILLFVLFVISAFFKINFTLGITSIFLISGLFFEDNSSFYVTNFSFLNKSKKLKQGMETFILSVNSNTKLYNVLKKMNKFKYNLVNVINENGKIVKSFSEEEINELFLSNSLDQPICECKM